MLSLLVGICVNTRVKPKGKKEVSAYSVFNDNCEAIDGTFKAEMFEKQLGLRQLWDFVIWIKEWENEAKLLSNFPTSSVVAIVISRISTLEAIFALRQQLSTLISALVPREKPLTVWKQFKKLMTPIFFLVLLSFHFVVLTELVSCLGNVVTATWSCNGFIQLPYWRVILWNLLWVNAKDFFWKAVASER